jgi:hypothetical protein
LLIPGSKRARKATGLVEKCTIVDRHHLVTNGDRASRRRRPEQAPAFAQRQDELLPQVSRRALGRRRGPNDIAVIAESADKLAGIPLLARDALREVAAVDLQSHGSPRLA